jgi:hypothetical protein
MELIFLLFTTFLFLVAIIIAHIIGYRVKVNNIYVIGNDQIRVIHISIPLSINQVKYLDPSNSSSLIGHHLYIRFL